MLITKNPAENKTERGIIMYSDARYDMNKFLKVKRLVDDGIIAKIDAARILCITPYAYNQRVKKLEKQGELNENQESEN